MIKNDFNPRQKISSLIAFAFIILLSLTLGWYSIETSENILAKMPESKIISIDKRMQWQNLQEKTEVKKIPQENGVQGQ